jgi:hypothetical protein
VRNLANVSQRTQPQSTTTQRSFVSARSGLQKRVTKNNPSREIDPRNILCPVALISSKIGAAGVTSSPEFVDHKGLRALFGLSRAHAYLLAVKVRFGLFAYAGQERFAAKGYSIARASVIFSPGAWLTGREMKSILLREMRGTPRTSSPPRSGGRSARRRIHPGRRDPDPAGPADRSSLTFA